MAGVTSVDSAAKAVMEGRDGHAVIGYIEDQVNDFEAAYAIGLHMVMEYMSFIERNTLHGKSSMYEDSDAEDTLDALRMIDYQRVIEDWFRRGRADIRVEIIHDNDDVDIPRAVVLTVALVYLADTIERDITKGDRVARNVLNEEVFAPYRRMYFVKNILGDSSDDDSDSRKKYTMRPTGHGFERNTHVITPSSRQSVPPVIDECDWNKFKKQVPYGYIRSTLYGIWYDSTLFSSPWQAAMVRRYYGQ